MRVILIYLLILSFARSGFSETPKFIRISFSQQDPSTTIAIAWNTQSLNSPTIVEYGEESSYGFKAIGSAFNAGGKIGAIHEVEISGLKPDTLYHYRVGGEGEWSEDRTFKTAPKDPCKPFTFIVLGDNRSDDNYGPSPKWNPILMEAAEYNPVFILNSGDLVRKGDDDMQWVHFLEASDPVLSFFPLMPAIGNHDIGSGEGDNENYNKIFLLPRNYKTNTEDFYYFVYGNLIVVSISTETYKDGSPPFSMQAQFLDEVLEKNPKMWKIVFLHHPNYTSHKNIFGLEINHPPNEKKQNAALIPVFDKHHVDFVFSGHNHWYERFEPLKGGNVVSSPEEGTIYITSGGAGALTYGLFNAVSFICGEAKGSYKCAGEHHYIKIIIDNNKVNVEVWASKAQLFGSSESNKKLIDSFAYEKSFLEGKNPCIIKPVEESVAEKIPEPLEEVMKIEPDIEKEYFDNLDDEKISQKDLKEEDSKIKEEIKKEEIFLGKNGCGGCIVGEGEEGKDIILLSIALFLSFIFIEIQRKKKREK